MKKKSGKSDISENSQFVMLKRNLSVNSGTVFVKFCFPLVATIAEIAYYYCTAWIQGVK